jgi:hypothetical protein
MSNINIFQNTTKTVPENDEQIVRVGMKQIDIQGRQDHLPAQFKSGALPLNHVPNSGTTPGGSA